MSIQYLYTMLAVLSISACASSKDSSPSAFAKTSHAPLVFDRDTFILDNRDTLLLDAIGQLYHWSIDQSVNKVRSVNQLGQSDTTRYQYQNPRLGILASVDLTNPIRPLLFYKDAQTVIWLNRNLSEWRSLKLYDLGYTAVDAVAYAPNEALWLYASDVQRLIQIDLNGNEVYQSAELNQVFNQAIRAEQLVANAQQVAMRTQDDRLLLFGPFAAYRSEILKGGRSLHVSKNRLLYYENEQWWQYRGASLPIEPVRNVLGKELVSLRSEVVLYRSGNRYWTEKSTP